MNALNDLLHEYRTLGIDRQVDYRKFYLYSLITHSTAIEGSTVTEVENQVLFDEGRTAQGRTLVEQLMNVDLKQAYEQAIQMAERRTPLSPHMLRRLAACVMHSTGSVYNTLQGTFDSARGDLRRLNVTAGAGGRSYMHYQKIEDALKQFCLTTNQAIDASEGQDPLQQYLISFDAHLRLVTIHPWVDGNGRMARLVMNYIQFVYGLPPARIDRTHKAPYIQALVDARERESTEPFRAFMLQEHCQNIRQEIDTYRLSLDKGLI